MTSSPFATFTIEVEQDGQTAIQALQPAIEAAAEALRQNQDPLTAFESMLARADHETRPLLRLDASDDASPVSDGVLFPTQTICGLTIRASGHTPFRTDFAGISVVSDYLRCAVSGQFSHDDLFEAQPELTHFLASTSGLVSTPRSPRRGNESGIFRMQHAGLLYQSETTRILVDPHFHSTYAPRMSTVFGAAEFCDEVDAVLISHSHSDHFSLSSLLFLPRDTLFIVPDVPHASLLCPDMAEQLRQLGFTNVKTPEWYDDAITVGDIEVFALPFYGEQPLASTVWSDVRARNWGNTYYLRTPAFTSLVLIDSGNDPHGNMLQVAEYVRSNLGPVDYLLSSLGEFHVGASGPRYIVPSGAYFLTLSRAQIQNFASLRGESLTLGPRGVAECCRACDARYFLPYAHWWGEPYAKTGQEQSLLPLLARALRAEGNTTTMVPWHIGERVVGNADDAVYLAGPAASARPVPVASFAKLTDERWGQA